MPGNVQRFWRKVIKISALDSPHVARGLELEKRGYSPEQIIANGWGKLLHPDDGSELYGNIVDYERFKKRIATEDEIRVSVGVYGEFYSGKELKLYPSLWLNRAVTLARRLYGQRRHARAIGVDPGEGRADTAWAVVDEYGLIELVWRKTADTSEITGQTLMLMKKHNIPPEYVCFDRGGGGKQHADRLRMQGFPVRTVSFGEPLLLPIKYGDTQVKERIVNREERYSFASRRAEMFGTLRHLLDPINKGFAIPAEYVRLRQQMLPIPLKYDEEGRLWLPPKNKKDPNSKIQTLIDIIGCSPDLLDALVVAVFSMTHKPVKARAGGIA